MTTPTFPYLGFGVGLRPPHYEAILGGEPRVDWFEALTENYMVPGGKPLHVLEQVRARYPLVFHGVSLSIGAATPLDRAYLSALRELIRRFEPAWISDHLCWTGIAGRNLHDLLPLPYTEEALDHVVARVCEVQDFLRRPILMENVSSYVSFARSSMTEWEFLAEVARRSGCYVLLDVNNIYVSSMNHGYDPVEYLQGIAAERVVQFHLAGHTDNGDCIIDTHDHPIADPVWSLYARAVERFPRASVMIERDDNIPPLGDLVAELDRARRIAASTAQALPA